MLDYFLGDKQYEKVPTMPSISSKDTILKDTVSKTNEQMTLIELFDLPENENKNLIVKTPCGAWHFTNKGTNLIFINLKNVVTNESYDYTHYTNKTSNYYGTRTYIMSNSSIIRVAYIDGKFTFHYLKELCYNTKGTWV